MYLIRERRPENINTMFSRKEKSDLLFYNTIKRKSFHIRYGMVRLLKY